LACITVQKQQRQSLLFPLLMRAEKGSLLLVAKPARGLYSARSLLKAQSRQQAAGVMTPGVNMDLQEEVKTIVIDVLSLGPAGASLTEHSALLGSIPELDSMAVVQLIGALEEQFGFAIDDDEISAATFATLGSLTDFVRLKQTA
jgi:acyl carrier protein